MAKKALRTNYIAIVSIKVIYYIAKVFGMTYFTITDRNRIKYSIRTHITSVAFRLMFLVGFIFHMYRVVNEQLMTMEMSFRVVILIHMVSIPTFTVIFTASQAVCHQQFVSIVNQSIDILLRISVIAKDRAVFSPKFYLLLWTRIAFNVSLFIIIGDMPKVYSAVRESNYAIVSDFVFVNALTFGIFIVTDTLCLGYTISSVMYANIGKHMVSLANRIEMTERRKMYKLSRLRVLAAFADELDECSLIYSQIYKITRDFHSLFQFNILFKFYIDFVVIIGCIHHNFLTYITTEHVVWSFVVLATLRFIDALYLIFVIDMTVRKSQIPGYLDWQSLCSDIDRRWDRSVEEFLCQLRFEELQIDVYGLFQLNNGFCLRGFSLVVAYLTILIQFRMLGLLQQIGA